MTSHQLSSDERKALELLPWYVNGTLEGDEREVVARQVLTSLTCRRELERLRRLHQLVRSHDAEAATTGRAFERLMARIDASEVKPRSRAKRSGRPIAWIPVALAASLAAGVSALLWLWDAAPPATPRTYDTLTSAPTADAKGTGLRVVFAPGVTESERLELLASHGLTTAEPATDNGVVTLVFADGTDRAVIVAALMQDPRISLVTSPPLSDGP